MEGSLYIKSYVHISAGKLYQNGHLVYESGASELSDVLQGAYRELDIRYPKFFKMDRLSKLAFMAAELFQHGESEVEFTEGTALVFCNRAASLDVDRKHWQAAKDPEHFYPSPADFVYTLPNICLGEISIRHGLHSENIFFTFDAFEPFYLHRHAENLISENKAGEVLCGWVDVDGTDYGAFLYLVSTSGEWPHQMETINHLYRKPWKI